MKRFFCILWSVACWVSQVIGWSLTAAVWLWFWPIALSMLADGSWQRQQRRQRSNEHWYKKHGFNQWLRLFEKQQHKKRKKQWKKRNDFYK